MRVNRRKELFKDVSDDDWNNWRWQFKNRITTLEELKELGYPLLLGTSRKSMIGKILDLPSNERLEGTIATSVIGVMKGMNILRVHDVKENLRATKVTDAILRGEKTWTE